MGLPRRARPAAIGAAALTAAVVLAGCGSEPAPVAAKGQTLRLVVDEYRIRPQALEVDAGTVRLVVENQGRLTHNVRVESEPETASDNGGEAPVVFGGTATAQPGETVRAEVPLVPGRYRLTCTIANHDNLGQYGTLVVRPFGARRR
jgi:plastocyanin